MRSTFYIVLFMLLFAFSGVEKSFSQNKTLDSLKLALTNLAPDKKQDTTRCWILTELSKTAAENEWMAYNDELMLLSEKKINSLSGAHPIVPIFEKYLATAYNNKAYSLQNAGDYLLALKFFEKSLQLRQKINDAKGIAQSLNNIATIFMSQGNVPKAIEYLEQSLAIREKIGDQAGTSYCLNNIGQIHQMQGELEKALEYYNNCLKRSLKANYLPLVYKSHNNIGSIYRQKNNFVLATENYQKSLEVSLKISDKSGIATALNNLGVICDNQKKYKEAEEFYNKSMLLRQELADKEAIAICMVNLGRVNGKLKKYKQGKELLESALTLAHMHGFAIAIREAAKELYFLNKENGDEKAAFENFEIYIKMNDSLNNEVTRKASIKSQLKYEYEKQAAADSVAHAKESEIKNVQLQKQTAEIKAKKNQQYALFGGLALVIIFAVFMFNRFKVTQKQKTIIEHQKEIVEEQKKLVEEKQKEVLDSIHYARRIQMAQIPSEKQIAKTLQRIKKV